MQSMFVIKSCPVIKEITGSIVVASQSDVQGNCPEASSMFLLRKDDLWYNQL
jgi:hypothetical protein